MTPNELKQRQRQLRMTSAQMAERLDVSVRTMTNWRSGAVPIPRTAQLAIEWLTRTHPHTHDQS